MKMSKEKRDRLILVGLLSLGVLGAVYHFVVGAQKKSLAQIQSRIVTARQNLDKAERWVRMEDGIHSSLEENRAALHQIEEQMAPLDRFKWFHSTLDTFLVNYAVRLEDITRTPEINPVRIFPQFAYQTATFGVRFSATYHDFGRFLADLENTFPYMRVQNVEMDPVVGMRGRTGSPRHNETLDIRIKVVTLVKPATSL